MCWRLDTHRLLPPKLRFVRAGYPLSPWFRDPAGRVCHGSTTDGVLLTIRSVRSTTFLIQTARMVTPITGSACGGRVERQLCGDGKAWLTDIFFNDHCRAIELLAFGGCAMSRERGALTSVDRSARDRAHPDTQAWALYR